MTESRAVDCISPGEVWASDFLKGWKRLCWVSEDPIVMMLIPLVCLRCIGVGIGGRFTGMIAVSIMIVI